MFDAHGDDDDRDDDDDKLLNVYIYACISYGVLTLCIHTYTRVR